MGTSKRGMANKRGRRTGLVLKPSPIQLADFFRPFGIPPTPLHEALQNAALKAGWIPPEVSSARKAKSQSAGRKSGQLRKGLADLRLLFVKAAHDNLKPSFRLQPFADQSIDALMKQYRLEITHHNPAGRAQSAKLLMSAAPFKADRDTLKKDLLRLGIRSKARKKRSG